MASIDQALARIKGNWKHGCRPTRCSTSLTNSNSANAAGCSLRLRLPFCLLNRF